MRPSGNAPDDQIRRRHGFPATASAASLRARPAASADPLLDDPILPRLLKLATPNALALGAGMAVVIAETTYVGRLGIAPLAAMALVFPFIMVTMTMSGGAMGGGVTSAIARALGARDDARASDAGAACADDRHLLRRSRSRS